MIQHPAEYRWSSYRANAQGDENSVITPHPLYIALHSDKVRRNNAYRELFRSQLEPGLVDEIRQATNGNYDKGSERFKCQITDILGRRVIRGKPGRPPTM
ncbi:MAG: hypothetical protein GY814_01345 [Gammaproteobacteria bacterium]|nr:hypothetical protein [Gammaproteobacteria bacterium]